MRREVKYCRTADGVRIAYSVQGSGPLAVMTPLLMFESFLLEDISPGYRRFSSMLAEGCQLVQYDCRGIGSSGKADAPLVVETGALDLEAVIAAVSDEPVALIGRANGSPVALHLAATRPELVSRLALHAPLLATNTIMSTEELTGIAQICRGNWDMGARLIADFSSRPEFGDAALSNAEWYQRSADGHTVAELWEANSDADVSDTLASISCSTTILQPMDDGRWVPEIGQEVAATIPGSTLVPLEGGLHSYALGDPNPLVSELLAFLGSDGRAHTRPAESVRAVLFSDIVGHTEMMSRLGDDRGREVLREHDRITRELLEVHAGTEVKTMGDGFMASFTSARSAVECAIGLQRAFADREGEPVMLRIGINVGEPIEEDDDLFGATVIVASRISAEAQGGEILVADAVRSLCAGKQITFEDRGEFIPKGFDAPVRISEAVWAGST